MSAAISLEELSERFDAMTSLGDHGAAIGITDAQTAAYARALEYGSVAGQRPWPHPGEGTVAAADPETGAQVVVSAQAPRGFIRVNMPQFLEQLRDAIAGPANWLDAGKLETHFAAAVQAAAAQTLETMRAAAPRDSRRLAQSLTILNP